MAGITTLTTIGNWQKEVGVPLHDALMSWMDVTGKSGERACRMAIVQMAKSAKSLTPKSKKNRKIEQSEYGKYVNVYSEKSAGLKFWPLYQWAYKNDDTGGLRGTWEDAKRIGNQGLAKRSWMWGMAKLGGKPESKPISGTSRVYSITRGNVGGYIKENKLKYLTKILPSGWEATVLLRAGNRLMGEAKRKLENQQRRAVLRRDRKMARGMNQLFLKGLS